MSYDTASIEDEMEAEEDSSSIVTSGSFGDNPVLNAVTTLLSKQHSVSMGDVLPLNAQLLVLTNAQSKSTLEANNHLGTGQGSGYNKTDNSDAFIPSLEQVHALATANLLASTQRDIAQQLAEASFTNPETETNKRQLSRPSPVKKKDSKSGRKIIVKAKSSASDDDLITQELTALTCSFSSCKRKFASATHLKYHEMTHTNNRQFECPDENCGKTFYTAQRLKVHLRTHTGEKPFKCSHKDCEKTFTTAGNLKNHERIHTGEQPFTCDYDGCSRRFTEYSSLHKHKLTHSGDKPFECKICNKKFTQSGSRRQHLIRHHLDEEIRNSLKASRYAKTKNNSSGDTREKNVRKSMRDNQLLVKSEAGNSTVSCSPQLMVLSNAFHTHPSSESVVSEHLVSLSSGGNHHLSLSNCHQQHVTEQNKISASHSLLNGLCEKNLDGKSNELVALSQTSVYHSDEQDRGVLYVTDMLDHEEITHADYHVSQDDASEGMISPLEYHHHHHHQNDNSIQTDISLHHSSECHHSGLYQNQQDFIQHEDLQHPNTGEYHTDVKGDISSSYLTADAGVLHEEFIGTKEVTISSSSGLADVSEEDPSYIHVKESVSTLIDWDEHLHKH